MFIYVPVANKWIHEYGQEFLRRCSLNPEEWGKGCICNWKAYLRGEKNEVRSQKRHGMGELPAVAGATGHREPEVYTSLQNVWRGSKARQMRSVAAGSRTRRPSAALLLWGLWFPLTVQALCLKMPQKAFLKQIVKGFFFLFKCLTCLDSCIPL